MARNRPAYLWHFAHSIRRVVWALQVPRATTPSAHVLLGRQSSPVSILLMKMNTHPLLRRIDPLLCALVASTLFAGCAVESRWPGEGSPPGSPATTGAGSLSGRVTGPDGEPLLGANVTTQPSGVETVTDADGAYAIARLVPGTYKVVAAWPGLVPGWSAEVEVSEGEGAVADVQLTTTVDTAGAGVLSVVVNGPYDLPWEGALVTATGTDVEVTAETDADGRATLTGLGGQTVDVTFVEPSGRLWDRTTRGLIISELAGASIAVTLSGRAADGTRYMGTYLCALCHADKAATYATTPHSRAMSAVEGDASLAFDDGAVVDLDGPVATLGRSGTDAIVTLEDTDGEARSFVVSGFIGGADRGAVPWTESDGIAWVLPVAWTAPDAARAQWSEGGWVAGDTDPWFAADGTFSSNGLPAEDTSAEARCFACHATGFVLADEGGGEVSMSASSGNGVRWVEAAVGCERCHGPGEDHTSGPLSEKPLRITNPADLDADRANDLCAQCHSGLSGAEGTPFAWSDTHALFLPGEDLADFATSSFDAWSNGTAHGPGQQADELAASLHGTGSWSARCSDCHDLHGTGATANLVQESADNTLCLSCHLAISFDSSTDEAAAHGAHSSYAPGDDGGAGRCTGCHMPPTAARLAWGDASGAGDLASHSFLAVPPSDSVAAFDAAGVSSLDPGEFPPNACQECHAWNEWLSGGSFGGPAGDMTQRATHEALQTAFEGMYP